MKIAMIASEANPLIKTGGLADVVYSLSKELTILSMEVIICLPFYKTIRNKKLTALKKVITYNVGMSWRNQRVDIYRTYIDGITYYLIDNEYYFNRDGSIYGHYDDGERFAFFTLAAQKLLKEIRFKPDIIHVHDWQAGMLPVLIREKKPNDKFFSNTKFVTTIHNPAFQGLYDRMVLGDFYGLSDELFDNGKLRLKGMVSTLKSAIEYSDMVTTVSPTHAQELRTSEGGRGLEGAINYKQDRFVGILNGIDEKEFNPKEDQLIKYPYNGVNSVKNKRLNKHYLMEKLHLEVSDKPVFGFVSRMTWQKGMDLVFDAVEQLLQNGAVVVLLGSGEYKYEQRAEILRAKFPYHMGIYIGYNDQLAHEIYAGSDFFLMPSLFEPCGIGQMIAERYGTLPIVRLTGGLKDSVVPFDGGNFETANGFGFANYCIDEMRKVIFFALNLYKDKLLMKKLSHNALKTDNSWRKSAKEYLNVYEKALKI